MPWFSSSSSSSLLPSSSEDDLAGRRNIVKAKLVEAIKDLQVRHS